METKNIAQLLQNSDAILVSLKDTRLFSYGVSPNKLYDAYAIGRPVITTIPGHINNEVLEYNLGTTSKASDPSSLASAVIKLIGKPRLEREKMGINARLLSEKVYSRQMINFKYYQILKEIDNTKILDLDDV